MQLDPQTGGNPETLYQQRALQIFIVVLSGIILFSTLYTMGNVGTDTVFGGVALIGLLIAFIISRRGNYDIASSLALATIIGFLVSITLTNGLGERTIFWFFSFPIMAFFFKGKKDGVLWLAILLGILAFLFLGSEFDFVELGAFDFGSVTFQQVAISLVIGSCFIYLYQDFVDNKQNIIIEREKLLSEIGKQLVEEIKENKAIAANLEANVEELEHEKSKAEALLQSIGEGVFAVDTDENVILTNTLVNEFFGIKEMKENQDWHKLFAMYDKDGKKLPKNEEPITKAIASGKPYNSRTHFYKNASGKLIPIDATAAPVLQNDENHGAVMVFRDVTEERAIDKAKNEFVSIASHQLRTPLTSINWYSEALLKKAGSKDPHKDNRNYVQAINSSSRRLATLVRDLLNVSRLELGSVGIEVKEFDLHDSVKKILTDLKPLIDENKINLTHRVSKDGSKLVSDQALVEMVIQNLLTNAIKYTPEGGKVTLHCEPIEDNKVEIAITDTGYGIPKSAQSKLFSKMFRAENITEKGIEGTGLGLYIVKSVVELLEGDIQFTSELDKGSTFTVEFPVTLSKSVQGTKKLEN